MSSRDRLDPRADPRGERVEARIRSAVTRRSGRPFRMVLCSALLLGFAVVLGLSIRSSVQPRLEGMTMTGGSGNGMAGMTMPSSLPVAGIQAADLVAAQADVQARRYAQAIPVYERVLRDEPHNLEARIHLGVSLAGIGRVERALAELDRALAMDTDNLHALWNKGQILFDIKGDHAASIPVWERIVALERDSPDRVTARGYALRARERLEGAPESKGGRGSR